MHDDALSLPLGPKLDREVAEAIGHPTADPETVKLGLPTTGMGATFPPSFSAGLQEARLLVSWIGEADPAARLVVTHDFASGTVTAATDRGSSGPCATRNEALCRLILAAYDRRRRGHH